MQPSIPDLYRFAPDCQYNGMMIMKKRKIPLFLMALFLILSGILYLLADRYLIEHVEIVDVRAAVAAQTISVAATPVAIGTESADTVAASPTSAAGVNTSTSEWNYHSDTTTINIRKVTTGSGRDTVTYFVADVVVKDATALQSAFAKNMFGRNIIEYTSAIAQENNAIFAINGDYYGFRNDGIVIRNGVIYRDSPVRTGLAFYKDGSVNIYDETQTTAQQLLADGVWNTLSFGPALIVDGVVQTSFKDVNVDTNFGNHSIQGNNPRTGVGWIDRNHFVFVVVDGRSNGYSRGVSLSEFAQIFKDLGCAQAYNIDGGGSSTLYFDGQVVNNPLGRNQERGTSDILFIGSRV
jgi:exopolysaccharide biosynthesis protein